MNDFNSIENACPYCGCVQTDLWEFNLGDGSTVETYCQFCEEKIVIKCSISIEYEITKPKTEKIPTTDV